MGLKNNIVSKNNILLFFIVYIQLMMFVALPTTRNQNNTSSKYHFRAKLSNMHNILPVMFHVLTHHRRKEIASGGGA